MNYFFLKIIFNDENNSLTEIDKESYLYEVVKCELQTFLEKLIKEEDLLEHVVSIFKDEIIEGEYIEDISLSEATIILENGIKEIFGYDYPELLEFYLDIFKEVKKEA
ncbi:MAG: hypothetical protein IJ086_15785 [Clostridium sp.]|nr:hypothetical protein [Clostridium sp.]MBQ9000135.1 hypothetical protein [Clostridium sp.]